MERYLLKDLVEWKNKKYRKPLILKGVRQVGKTWLLKEFGIKFYDNIAYFNFEESKELTDYFKTTKDVKRILQNLALINGKPILPEKTLIIFDEIQESNDALNTLKYFYENAPEYHIVCAGSLLGIALSKPSSFPVGKVELVNIMPMTFTEFLMASGDGNLIEYIHNINAIEPIPDIFFNPLYEKLKIYHMTGGMPEPVRVWTENNDISVVQNLLRDILQGYELDFSKHISAQNIAKLNLIWSSIPSQLARENKKFIYNIVKEGARAREYEDALVWLNNAGMVYKIYRITKPGLPLSTYDDLSAFKLYTVDVGLLRMLSKLDSSAFKEGNRLFTEFKGALAENFALQSIVARFNVLPRYWTSKAKAEVDFILQHFNDIYPIEVKSSENVKSRSLRMYINKYKPKFGIRLSLRNLKYDNDILNIPLFLTEYIDKFINLVKQQF